MTNYGIELDFYQTFTVYTDDTETEEKSMNLYVLVRGVYSNMDGELDYDYSFTISSAPTAENVARIIEFFHKDSYDELCRVVEDKVLEYITEQIEEIA